jgi:hypothetical protein
MVNLMADTFELVQLRVPEGLSVYLKHRESPWMFRVLPVRDPDQPRLWCLRVEPCAGPSLSAKTASLDPFYTCLGMARERLAETLDAIHRDAVAWLADEATTAFRDWLSWVTQLPVPSNFIAPDPPVRAGRSSPGGRAVIEEAGTSPAPPSGS